MITQDRMEQALRYLATTDEEAARKEALYRGREDQLKTIEAQMFGLFDGPMEDRKQKARASQEYQDHLLAIDNARLDFLLIKTKRETEALIIDVWRSLNANRRMG